jgi:hypothetical protein
MREFIKSNNVRYPAVVANRDSGFEVVVSSSELAAYRGDATKLVEILREKGYMQGQRASL